jgi:CubicO group peptidase (beta-lactamase class C family)
MQTVGRIAELRTGQTWEQIASTRIFDRCAMPTADYQEFAPNPAVAGGMRGSADETIRYAQMVVDRGWYAGQRVLSDASIEQLFTNATRDLPVHASPWPVAHPLYPYGADPDYGFGTWILAENPATQHVEEIVGAGAWGSLMWIDRRRGLTAVLITDVPAGTQGSLDAALGLFAIARKLVESEQARNLVALHEGASIRLRWERGAGSIGSRLYGSTKPIRDLFDLRTAVVLGQTVADTLLVPVYPHYAVTTVFARLENTALVPRRNSVALGD